jgi:hypothetical protein
MIYILDQDLAKSAQAVANNDLEKQIKAIAQTLCNVHHDINQLNGTYESHHHLIPMIGKDNKFYYNWTKWARECVANYKWLVNLGMHCCIELILHRGILKCKKYQLAIDWASSNAPDLPEFIIKDQGKVNCFGEKFEYKSYNEQSPFPTVMPKKYQNRPYENYGKEDPVIESYRSYYQHKLQQRTNCIACNNTRKSTCSDCENCFSCIEIMPKWTRREKPEWLNL